MLEEHKNELDQLDTIAKLDLMNLMGLIYTPNKEGGQPRLKRYRDTHQGVPLQDIWSYQPFTNGILFDSDEAIEALVQNSFPTF